MNVGSRRRRHLLWTPALAFVALVCATPAIADPADDARATATKFLNAYALGDAATICSMFSPSALARVGGEGECREAFTETMGPDSEAVETLIRGLEAARKSANRRHAGYVTKRFKPRNLALDMERIDSQLEVKLGRRPSAAAGQLATTVVLDTRSTARRLVLYAESDDGSILRLSAPRKGREISLAEVAQGIAETGPPPPPKPSFAFTIVAVDFMADGTVHVRASIFAADGTANVGAFPVLLVLVPAPAGGYLVDDLMASAFPPIGGSG
jgi:hypothetical protein